MYYPNNPAPPPVIRCLIDVDGPNDHQVPLWELPVQPFHIFETAVHSK
jgi:hypothetical protein